MTQLRPRRAGQSQPGQYQPGQSQPGQSQPGQSQPGQYQPGQYQPGRHRAGGALAGSLRVDAGQLRVLCVTGAVLAAAGLLVLLAARRAFPPSAPGTGPDLDRPDRQSLPRLSLRRHSGS